MSYIVLFDFDGTLTKRDTTRDLFSVLARHRPERVILALPWLLALIFTRCDAKRFQVAKCHLLGALLRGLTYPELVPLLARFRDRVLPILRSETMRALVEHQKRGAQVLVVTASPRLAVEAVLALQNIKVIGTEYKQANDRFSSELLGVPCYGAAKVDLILEFLKQQGQKIAVCEAWSDSWSDHPMMGLASRRVWLVSSNHAKTFRARDPESEIVICM